jgi:uncharacterized membrane protein
MLSYVIAYLATAAVFLSVDLLWLSRMMSFYKAGLGDLLTDRPNIVAAVTFYVIYIIGAVVFAVMPSARSGSWTSAALLGGLLGLVAFATYDLTNLSTLRRWSVLVAVVDIGWGIFVTALSSMAGYAAISTLARSA